MDVLVCVVCFFALHAAAFQPRDEKRILLHGGETDVLTAIHDIQTSLSAANALIANLSAALQVAETKIADLQSERCKMGSLHFTHLQCATTTQCSQTQTVHFSPSFKNLPTVSVSLRMIDAHEGYNLRIAASVTNVFTGGATFTVNVWDNTIVYESDVSWIACPQ